MRSLSFAVLLFLGCAQPAAPEEARCLAGAAACSLEGSYSTIEDGSTTILALELLPEGAFRWTLFGCFASSEATGRFRQQGDRLFFTVNERGGYVDGPQILYLRRWEGRNILLDPKELAAFEAAPSSSFGYLQEPIK